MVNMLVRLSKVRQKPRRVLARSTSEFHTDTLVVNCLLARAFRSSPKNGRWKARSQA